MSDAKTSERDRKIAQTLLRLQTLREVSLAAAGTDQGGPAADRLRLYASLVHLHHAVFDELIDNLQKSEKQEEDNHANDEPNGAADGPHVPSVH